jgi:hypothetical protein
MVVSAGNMCRCTVLHDYWVRYNRLAAIGVDPLRSWGEADQFYPLTALAANPHHKREGGKRYRARYRKRASRATTNIR